MFGARPSVALALACALLPAVPRPVAADAPVPLDYKAYDGWNRVVTPKLSDDGRKLAYALTPQDGDPTLVVRDLGSGAERRESRGNAPAFAAGARFVVFTHVAPKKDVDAALRFGYADSRRVGIAGHSWAAYQINYLITKSHRFRAAEAGAAVDDMIGAYSGIRLESGIVREGQYEHGQSRIGAPPWDRPDLYIENSGLFGIKHITTPYLTIHNELDGAVPQFQGIEFITAMRRLGKEAYLFSFDGEDHNLKGREQQKYWTVHLDEWFDHWLKGAARPAWMNGVDYLHRGERNVRPLFGETD